MQAGQDLKLADLIVRRREYLEAQRKNKFVFTDLIVGPCADDFHFLYELIQTLVGKELQSFKKVVAVYAPEIVQKWVDYSVYHRSIRPKTITRKLPRK